METAQFLDKVQDLVNRLPEITGNRTKQFSDIVDAAGNQYVDLVMEGGGVLGVALLGYTYILEQAGLRFLGVGGTSAGSINAIAIAAAGTPADEKSPRIIELLANKSLFDFVDGDDDARDAIEAFLDESSGKVKLLIKAAQVIDNLQQRLGLNPGENFRLWVKNDMLQSWGIASVRDLRQRMNTVPPMLATRDGKLIGVEDMGAELKIVAADVTTETKAIFPEMAELYWQDPDAVNPAEFVRASMSIPFFFEPYSPSERIPGDRGAAWKKRVGLEIDPARVDKVRFVDGGIMSNFPINLFHQPGGNPTAPTFGARLGTARMIPPHLAKEAELTGTSHQLRRFEPHKADQPFAMLGAIFDSARHCLDFDFIARNPEYNMLVATIDTGNHNWLNFFLTDEAKLDLFQRGAQAAFLFLKWFDWAAYKKLRAELSRLHP